MIYWLVNLLLSILQNNFALKPSSHPTNPLRHDMLVNCWEISEPNLTKSSTKTVDNKTSNPLKSLGTPKVLLCKGLWSSGLTVGVSG